MATKAVQSNASIESFGTTLVHVPASPRSEVVFWAQWSVLHQGRFRYTMDDPERRQMFDDFDHLIEGKHKIDADCSQFAAAIIHHVSTHNKVPAPRAKKLTHLDYTGTLLKKGLLVPPSKSKPGDVIIFGGDTGKHAAIKTYNGFCIGFGHWPGAPNRNNIVEFAAWFKKVGHPGVRYLSFFP